MERFSSSTAESVLSALDRADGVEIDLNLSSDGLFYFYHEGDWTSDRLARVYSMKELERQVPKGESLLSFDGFLSLIGDTRGILCIHLEIGGGGDAWERDFTLRELARLLVILKNHRDTLQNRAFFHTIYPWKAKLFADHGFVVFHRGFIKQQYGMYRFSDFTKLISMIDVSKTMVYVINDPEQWDYVIGQGAGYVLTDTLSLLHTGLHARGYA